MNWDDTRIFLAIYRERSLRGAARIVGLDQATVGRRLAALERVLGATLFLRTSVGYVPTAVGEVALRNAEKMEQSAIDLVRQTQGVDRRLAGDVRVTTTDTIGLEFVMAAIRTLHDEHPDVRVLLNTSTHVENLAKRDADIAIRTIKPDNPDLLMRRLAAWPTGLYASADYLERHGEPAPGTGFEGHDLVCVSAAPECTRPAHGSRRTGPRRADRVGAEFEPDAARGGARRARACGTPGADRGARRAGARVARAYVGAPLRSLDGDAQGFAAHRADQRDDRSHRAGVRRRAGIGRCVGGCRARVTRAGRAAGRDGMRAVRAVFHAGSCVACRYGSIDRYRG